VRHEYAVLLSRRTGVDLPVVESAVSQAARRSRVPDDEDDRPAAARPLTGEDKVERELLRLVLANDPELRTIDMQADLFERPEHRAAFESLWPEISAIEPGAPPDLGRLIGDDSGALGETLRRLALAERPLADPGEMVVRLKVRGIERRIDSLRNALEDLDPDEDRQGYSDTFAELIALERERRDLRRAM
jgi:hypothetical protein